MFVRRRNLNQIFIDKRHFNAKVWILLEVTSLRRMKLLHAVSSYKTHS